MTETDIIRTAFMLSLLVALLFLAYRRDIREARYFSAVRRASTHPYADREWHRNFARKHKFFWRPCPCCGEDFGGHEMLGKTVPHNDPLRAARGERLPICPPCAVGKRNPGTSSKDYNGKLARRATNTKKD